MLEVILFDVGKTLVDNESWKDTVDQTIYRVVKKLDPKVTESKFKTVFEQANEDYKLEKAKNEKLHSGTKFVLRKLGGYLGKEFTSTQIEELKEVVDRHRLEKVLLLDNVQNLLPLLAKRFKLYVVSRGDGKIVRSMLKKLKVDSYFKDFFITEERNSDKESGALFKIVVDELKLDPKRTLMVGNELKVDGRCMDFGIPFCFIDRLNENPETGYTFKISSLNDLPNILNFLDESAQI